MKSKVSTRQTQRAYPFNATVRVQSCWHCQDLKAVHLSEDASRGLVGYNAAIGHYPLKSTSLEWRQWTQDTWTRVTPLAGTLDMVAGGLEWSLRRRMAASCKGRGKRKTLHSCPAAQLLSKATNG